MGKSFANFMCKKFFHPSSFANIKRVWLAEQRVKEEKQKQDNLREEYEKDQDHYNNRQLMGDERVKHGLTFIYEAPKAYQKETEKEEEGRLVWKRAAPAPVSEASAGGSEGGAVVKNVRCVKCNQMGHIPTDRECPMYKTTEEKSVGGHVHQDQLVEDMRRDGYAFKQSVLGRSIEDAKFSKDLIGDEGSDDGLPPEEAFLSSLTKKQKKQLLKKLNRMEKRSSGSVHKKKKSHKKRRRSDSSSSSDRPKKHSRDDKKHKRKREMSSDSSSSDENSDGRHRRRHDSHQKRSRSESSSSEREARKHHRDQKQGKRRRDRREDSRSDDEKMDGRHHRQLMKSRECLENRDDRKSRDFSKMHDDFKHHRSDKHSSRDLGIKKERISESPQRGRHGKQHSSSDKEDTYRSKPSRNHDLDNPRNRHSNHSSKKISHREYDERERETPRIKVEDRREDRRGREHGDRNPKNYSDSGDDRYSSSRKDRK